MKPVSILALLFVLIFVLLGIPTIKAQLHENCLQEYVPASAAEFDGFTLCKIPGYPSSSPCAVTCRKTRDATSGMCLTTREGLQCYCNFCSISHKQIR
ncbi:unnamed protein product [Microthlaspi erraticum]|uniref:Knottin scorpion toxin-like domain-containing protein n=1 Tax=Microthlaspi erraticum TaxID=1685480 RepID=A0A6D2IZH0_9BRAS|nr:unnamed protein product [Microthlaspi erraticum]